MKLTKLFQFSLTCFIHVFCNSVFSEEIKINANFPDSVSPGQSFETEFVIEKGSVTSFAKFQVDCPSGFYASPVDIHSGNWTFEQQRVKIVWVSVPSETSFRVKLNFKAPSTYSSASAIFAVKFFYLENNVKKELDLTPFNVKVNSGSNTSSKNTSTTSENKSADLNTVNSTNENVAQISNAENNSITNVVSEKVETKKEVEKVSIVFRLQLGAFSTKPALSKFNGLKDLWIYEEKGLFKVTTGKFDSLQDAEKYKAELKNKGTEGFVVEFDNGVHVKIH